MPQTNGKNRYRAVPANFWAQKISIFLRRFLLLVMRFPVIANWSNPPQTFAYKRFEEGTDFCESTDFLSEALSTLLELV